MGFFGANFQMRLYYAIINDDAVSLKHMLNDGVSPNYKFKGSNQNDKR